MQVKRVSGKELGSRKKRRDGSEEGEVIEVDGVEVIQPTSRKQVCVWVWVW
jgi:hypothetical protein